MDSPEFPIDMEDNISGYEKEYEELKKIGEGGFASVFRVKSKLDCKEYAVKKVKLRTNEQSSDRYCLELREVRALAKLEHKNIVRYYTAWLENKYLRILHESDSSYSESSDKDEYKTSAESSGITFQSDEDGEDGSGSEVKGLQVGQAMATFEDTSDMLKSETETSSFQSDEDGKDGSGSKILLYILMELCSSCLKTWLDDRNEKYGCNKDYQINVDIKKNIFRQILEGVRYIHSQGLIHRDLKPGNIFFQGSKLDIKIGDFGLVKDLACSCSGDELKRRGCICKCDKHTEDIGTTRYASPEQRQGQDYDTKSDIYSLGIILLELFHPFNSGMERAEVIENLKGEQHIIPQCINVKVPQVGTILMTMTSSDVDTRPTAEQLLQTDFFSYEEEINEMRRKLENSKKQLNEMRRKLENSKKQRDIYVEKIRAILTICQENEEDPTASQIIEMLSQIQLQPCD